MAILRSSDGKFYDVSDDQLEGKMIPADEVKSRLTKAGPGPQEESASADVEAHGWCWRRNYFHNCWRRNCWRNYCRGW